MSYKDFLWEDQTVNGILVKTVRVRVREVSSSDKISVEKSSTGYSDGNTGSVKRSRCFRDFTIILKSEVPRTTGNYKAKKENYIVTYRTCGKKENSSLEHQRAVPL